jgi:HSP20 family protein
MNTEKTTMSKRDNQSPEKLQRRPTYAPPCDIYENKDEILILADVPGATTESVAISLDKDQLTIEAHRSDVGADEEPYDFRRAFVVPRGIDGDKITANLQNGVLRLSLRKPVEAKPRQIAVTSG